MIYRILLFIIIQIFTISYQTKANNIVDLRNKMPPVKGQGKRNLCSAFSATSLMEFLIMQYEETYLNLSEEYNYWASKRFTLTNKVLKGYENIDALPGYLAVKAYEYGSVLEKNFPYKQKNRFQLKDPLCKKVEGKYINECFTYKPPENISILPYTLNTIFIEREDISRFIVEHKKPVIMNIMWCYDVIDKATGNFRIPTENELNNCRGHVITLVGYNTLNKEFIYRNSFGPNWGGDGYGTIPEKYIVEYCESCPYLKILNQFSPERQDLYVNSSKGISGKLINH